MKLTRKEVLKLGAVAGMGLFLPQPRTAKAATLADRIPASRLPEPFLIPLSVPPVLIPVRRTSSADFYSLTQRPANVQILPGFPKTRTIGYFGVVPGPTIFTRRGDNILIRHVNAGPRPVSHHLAGLRNPLPQYAGYANDVIPSGFDKVYRYSNLQPGRTLRYQDNAWRSADRNHYANPSGLLIAFDDHEDSLPIPQGRFAIPLDIKDAVFSTDGQFIFEPDDREGVLGDVILVNGTPWPRMRVERRKYRFRISNASVSRPYELALSSEEPISVIGTDGGLMPRPALEANTLTVGVGERYDVIIDFAKYQVGQQIVLQNLRPTDNFNEESTRQILRFDVVSDATDTRNNQIPLVLRPVGQDRFDPMALNESQAVRHRVMTIGRSSAGRTINGRTWENVVASHFTETVANPALNDVEVWEFVNSGDSVETMHFHALDFKILDRNGAPPFPYELGAKNTVCVDKGEKVRIIVKFDSILAARFAGSTGRYMVHTTNLVHHDDGMMAQFQVGRGGPDPIETAPARRFR